MTTMARSQPTASTARRPRIGVDFHTFDGIFQGSRSHLLGVYREAVRTALDIDFVFFVGDPERLRREDPAFSLPNVTLVRMKHRSAFARLGWQLAWAQLRHRIDLLHVQYRLPLLPLGPCAVTVHDVLFETHPQYFSAGFARMARWTGRWAARHARLLFTVSDYSRSEMMRLYGLAQERIHVTCNAVDSSRFLPGRQGMDLVRRRGLTPGRYLCTVGRIEPRKNHLKILQAYALLVEQHGPALAQHGMALPPLVVIGQRDFGDQAVFDEVRRLGIETQVVFLETVTDEELPALIRHARVFTYLSLAEGFGMPVLEAMACSVPVITSNTTALPEVAGDAALLVDPEDAQTISLAMARLMLDPWMSADLGRRGVEQAARFRWTSAARSLVSAFRQHFNLEPPLEEQPQPWPDHLAPIQQRAPSYRVLSWPNAA
ncbi:glycosyltransferase involved in cell wall biosynthesis [Sphaerotilus hippei]|uniref:Glycosyltransferase involved in cell wall biosynthesis n=1 Tax=Sphaerotilus hippei TaxID=744406 RepID=A0A318H0D8_9BURK|nr:glycosyltransferase family 1 protein [Sphaerotilus hippei]PXW96191.1 glycosyltransferase involved in cell wall biosynthesis [Sphaerotilus hippei]